MSLLWKNDWILNIFMKAGLLNPTTHSKNSLLVQEGVEAIEHAGSFYFLVSFPCFVSLHFLGRCEEHESFDLLPEGISLNLFDNLTFRTLQFFYVNRLEVLGCSLVCVCLLLAVALSLIVFSTGVREGIFCKELALFARNQLDKYKYSRRCDKDIGPSLTGLLSWRQKSS